MKYYELDIPDLVVFENCLVTDERGFFYESFNQNTFTKLIKKDFNFVQDNISISKKNVLRGLHYQITAPQGKLVQVLNGEAFDVAVDLRKSSKTFGMWESVYLSDSNNRQFWIPEGFAHGFVTLSESVTFLYKTTDFYNKDGERQILWNDPFINIKWPITDPILSPKDSEAKLFLDSDLFD